MEDLAETFLRFIVRLIRDAVEALGAWFWEAGISKLPRKPSQFRKWWREESSVSKIHSVTAAVSFVTVSGLMVLVIGVLIGIDPFGIGN